MAAFFARRLLIAIPTIFGVTLVVFAVIQVTPGDPAAIAAGPVASDEQIEELRERLGLDKPIIVQYFNWVGNAAQGDLGRSIQFRRPVTEQIVDKAGNTALLVFTSVAIAAVVGIALGLLSGSRPNTWMDRLARVFGSMGISMPEFALGLLLIIIFSVELDLLPTSGMRPPGSTTTEVGELAKHLVLPAVTLAVPQIAITSRLTRSSFLQVISQDYIRTARAKGLRESLVLGRHALRNIMIPLVTIVGWQLGYLLSASILVETVFGWPGLGNLMVLAVDGRDFPLLQGTTLVLALAVVLANILVDMSYGLIDPRVKAQ